VPPNASVYVYDSNPGDIDAYTLTPIGEPSAIVGIQLVASAMKDDSSSRILGLGFGNATTMDFNAGDSVADGYLMYTQPYDVNPLTSSPFTNDDLNNGQIGLKVIA
jgi:hypothetical protein